MEIVLTLVVLAVAVAAFFFLKKAPPADAPPPPSARTEEPSPKRVEPAPVATPPKEPARAVETAAPAAETARVEASSSLQEELAQPEVEDLESSEEDGESSSPPPPPVRAQTVSERSPAPSDLQSLRKGLAKSRQSEGFFGRLRSLLGGRKEIASDLAAEIEEVLLTSDVGVATTEAIITELQTKLSRGELENEERVWAALRAEAQRILSVGGSEGGIQLQTSPTVVLLVGVNGAGKTTTIGKLAKKLTGEGKKVMLAAGDTFRAAAVDQLKAWGDRTGCTVIAGKDNADPSSVLFDAIRAAREAQVDVLLADTAGRLHTKTNLMQEMTKIARTAGKALDGAPHEVLLVLDSTNGQNALAQAKEFKEALPLTGLVLTKLDGTARGGVVLGICGSLQVPVRYVGLGEKAEDLHEFSSADFVEALLGKDNETIPS